MTVLVLGATGFVGKAACAALEQRGRAFTRSSLSLGVDLRERDQAFELFAKTKPDAVINCASFVGGIQYGYAHPAAIFDNNARMIANIFATEPSPSGCSCMP